MRPVGNLLLSDKNISYLVTFQFYRIAENLKKPAPDNLKHRPYAKKKIVINTISNP